MSRRKREYGPAVCGLLLMSWAMSAVQQAETVPASEPLVTIESPFEPLITTSPKVSQPDAGCTDDIPSDSQPASPGPEKPDSSPVAPPPPGSEPKRPDVPLSEPPAPEPESAQDNPPDLARFVHRIARNNNGRREAGSAVCIGGGRFLTNAHVVSGGGWVELDGKPQRGNQQHRVQVQILSPHNQHDLAIVTIPGNTDEGCEISTEWVNHLDLATCIGFPGQETEPRVSQGLVFDFDRIGIHNSDEGVDYGMSGGGVFVNGKLVGILNSFTSGDQSLGKIPENKRAAHWSNFAYASRVLAGIAPAPFAASAPAAIGPHPPSAPPDADNRPVVYLDVPVGGWCAVCNGLEKMNQSSLEFQMVFRRVGDQRHPYFPHVHIVDRNGREVCTGPNGLGSIEEITAAWKRLY